MDLLVLMLVVGLLGGDDRSIGDQGEVDPGVGHQVGLELSQVDVEGAVEAEGGRDGGHDLADQTIEVGVGGANDCRRRRCRPRRERTNWNLKILN